MPLGEESEPERPFDAWCLFKLGTTQHLPATPSIGFGADIGLDFDGVRVGQSLTAVVYETARGEPGAVQRLGVGAAFSTELFRAKDHALDAHTAVHFYTTSAPARDGTLTVDRVGGRYGLRWLHGTVDAPQMGIEAGISHVGSQPSSAGDNIGGYLEWVLRPGWGRS